MQIENEVVRAALIAYRNAHLAWKSAPDGPEKVAAKRLRGKLHGKLLELAALLEQKEK